jgi:hypothetical protein
MSRYIEYEPIMAELEKEVKLADDWKTAHEIANVVKYASSIDICFCKDCSYRNEINCPQYYRRTELRDDDFCSYGIKRGVDDE